MPIPFPLQMVEFTTKGGQPLLKSTAARALFARLLEFYQQVSRLKLYAYCIHPRGARFIIKEGPGYEFLSALEALRCNSDRLLEAQLAKEGTAVDGVWRGLYQQKPIKQPAALRWELDDLRHLPVRLGLAQHPADYQFSKTELTISLDLSSACQGRIVSLG